ncbi:uncharacterized protein GIQ15_01157 [Arthroderma uncinatum]|uniref:uncharacterized protein n=1 Tax=Arthroderma uncinatum TaxID=74035 RepID=UPI00144A57AD|nr:uncharacterized protein GIQ15_01157 [Arthroderma uncinatum]KAF3491640.1 hypothetical protein GIQ15_01157 [Arthroderma uncinatum]
MSPPSVRRALIIASPYGGLRGTLRDAERISAMLKDLDFDITQCCGKDATRDGIRAAWNSLIKQTGPEDVVVIYYSGHGGMAKRADAAGKDKNASKNESENEKSRDKDQQQWRYQFLVPVDFDQSAPDDFRGITEIEISHLLRDTTDQTRNVTVILDCCHSGRMAREPTWGGNATPKNLSLQGGRYYHDIERSIDRLLQARNHTHSSIGDLSSGSGGNSRRVGREEYIEGNPHAVRIAAAATTETAWEYEDSSGYWTGALTNALVRVFKETKDHSNSVSWRTTVLRVRELVNAMFPLQHPQIEGPVARCHFSLEEMGSDALHLKLEGDDGLAVIQAGRVAGVREGNVYRVFPFSATSTTTKDGGNQVDTAIADAVVTHVDGFRAVADLKYKSKEHTEIPPEGALARLEQEALNKWPVTIPSELLPSALEELIRGSRYLCIATSDEREAAIGRIQRLGDRISLRTREGVQVASQWIIGEDEVDCRGYKDIVTATERLAKAQHLLSLDSAPAERLEHNVEVEFRLVEKGERGRTILSTGDDHVNEGERWYVSLRNNGQNTVHATLFNVNVAGKISLISKSHPTGIELPPTRSYTVGADRLGLLRGLGFSFPRGIPQERPVNERLVVILTSRPVDLWHLTEAVPSNAEGRSNDRSTLQKLTMQISRGGTRDMDDEDEYDVVCYDIAHIPFNLQPRGFNAAQQSIPSTEAASEREMTNLKISESSGPEGASTGEKEPLQSTPSNDLPPPESLTEWAHLPPLPPDLDPSPRGMMGALTRVVRRIPPCVWVVNQHIEEVTVVVSKYHPNRILTGGGINASISGAGIDLSSTTFTGPATKKTLQPQSKDPQAAIGVFPLWSRNEGFGVITIFTGPERTLFSENDLIPAGATAYFVNRPDLRIVEFKASQVEE